MTPVENKRMADATNRWWALPALVSATLLACADIRPALAAELLNAELECPRHGPHRACLLASVIREYDDDACSWPLETVPLERVHAVTGRLNGMPPQRYRLRVDRSAVSWASPSTLAYLGESPSGHAIVLTDRGPLEIHGRAFRAADAEIYLVDKRRWRIMGRIIATGSHPVVTDANDIGIWDKERGLCISAVMQPRRRLRVIAGGCATRPKEPTELDRARETTERFQNELRGTLRVFAEWYASKRPKYTPPPPETGDWADWPSPGEFDWLGNVEREYVTLRKVRRLLPDAVNFEMGQDDDVASFFGGMGAGIRVLRIKGSNTLIMLVSYDHEC
jgi:hypothetical protein